MITVGTGVLLAIVTMISWGIGDFLIQKSTRKIGDLESLFVISVFGTVVISPFVWSSLSEVVLGPVFFYVICASVVLFLAGLLQFEALREGKISVVEPTWSLEIPAAALLAFAFLGEEITPLQIGLIVVLMISLIGVAFRTQKLSMRFFVEKGLLLAIVAGIVSGSANFFVGWGGRISNPLVMIFFYNITTLVLSGVLILYRGRGQRLIADVKHSWHLLLPMSFFDTIAWISFIFSMSLIPIAVATALSESYIVIAVLLGLFVNKEKLQRHQKWALVGAILSAICLAVVTV